MSKLDVTSLQNRNQQQQNDRQNANNNPVNAASAGRRVEHYAHTRNDLRIHNNLSNLAAHVNVLSYKAYLGRRKVKTVLTYVILN